MQQAHLGAPDLTSLPSEIIETICQQLERLWPNTLSDYALKDKVALTSCCHTLWARQDLLTSQRLWGSLELNGYQWLFTGRKRQSLATWLARHSLGIRRLLLRDSSQSTALGGDAPDAFWPLQHLRSLTAVKFKNVQLNAVPPQLTALSALADLDLGGYMPVPRDNAWAPLAACTSLTRLDISGCFLPSRGSAPALPKELSAMSALRQLVMTHGGRIGEQDAAVAFAVLGSLMALTSIDMSTCVLKQLPPQLAALPHLQALSLCSNQLGGYDYVRGSPVEPDPAAFQVLPQLDGLSRLDLSSNCLRRAPESLSALSALADLDLSFNRLGSGSAALGSVLSTLSSLSRLALICAELDRLPPELTRLPALAELDVSRNESLGSTGGSGSALWPLQHLSGLTQLALRNINLQGTPVDLSACSRLANLALDRNGMLGGHELLAQQLDMLPLALACLDLSACSLHALPFGISTLTCLAEFNLSGNLKLGKSSTLHAQESLPGLKRLRIGSSGLGNETPLLSSLKSKGVAIDKWDLFF